MKKSIGKNTLGFQFHLVRLKVYLPTHQWKRKTSFQFHLVRLKEPASSEHLSVV